ncbi:hypothetical protein CUMW_017830, partial [Citrus unshiu]
MALTINTNPQKPNGEIEETISFPRFDVVSDVSDHHYITSSFTKKNGRDHFPAGSHKKIMQEWKILEKHLPESIFVRVYENRIDLLRAVISYLSGHVRVGYYLNEGSSGGGASSPGPGGCVDVSEKFQGLIVQLYPELVTAFSRTGASLGSLTEQVKFERKTVPFKGEGVLKQKKEKNTSGIARKVFGKIKVALGLKKNGVIK